MTELPRSSLGIMLQSHAEILEFVARHRTKAKAAQSAEVKTDRIKWAWDWLKCARTERLSRAEQVSAFIITRDGKRVATVAFKFPKADASRLYAYVHFIGAPMVRGSANGYGYDERSAAVADAVKPFLKSVPGDGLAKHWAFGLTLSQDDSQDWTRALENAGFTVRQAV